MSKNIKRYRRQIVHANVCVCAIYKNLYLIVFPEYNNIMTEISFDTIYNIYFTRVIVRAGV